jgi:hypothetical protein
MRGAGIGAPIQPDIIFAMCQGDQPLRRLAIEQSGAIDPASRFAAAIEICWRRVWRERGVPRRLAHWSTMNRLIRGKLAGLDIAAGVFVKRGDLHALVR